MVYCSVLECKNFSGQNNLLNGGVSYHRFPKNADIKEAWIKATGRTNWMPAKSCTICSEHFSENNFLLSKKGYRYLKTNAIPNLKVMFYCEKYQSITRTEETSKSEKEAIEPLIQQHSPAAITISGPMKRESVSNNDYKPVTLEKKSLLAEHNALGASENPTKLHNVDAEPMTPKIKTRIFYVPAGVQEKSDGRSERLSCVYSPPRKQKLLGQLRWALEKIKSKNLKIKRLQTQNRRLKKKLTALEEIVKAL